MNREETPTGSGGKFPLDEYSRFQGRLAAARDLVVSGLELLPPLAAPCAERVRERLAHGVPVIDLDPDLPSIETLAAAAGMITESALEHEVIGEEEHAVIERALAIGGGAFIAELLPAMFRRDADAVAALARREGISPEALLLLGEHLARPVLERQTRGVGEHLPEDPIDTGTCPACGNPPRLSLLSGEGGKRRLVCGMCRTEWPYQRIGCPFCGCVDQARLRYFAVDDEPDRAVEVCDGCRRYLKQVRFKHDADALSPMDLDVASARLDVLARREGFR
ncbi:MAG TPA: formate dehydrogenase accessory protein FdhE [Polyangia bacterium]|nr:formate dehydrogenase accessory protein FdhE [Polyangia bacterium]